ncbi:hypothetical protein SAMN05444167_2732 [Terriglobus roseus]|uniref:Uncharacterized protein n=1 Tax=Terriglobus roseus TaxID=392734 RepID=A0A1G7M7V8_9BACT|nr:hypothetical protein SAMN05444167_2732 [Terriglobus roseus]
MPVAQAIGILFCENPSAASIGCVRMMGLDRRLPVLHP